MSGPGAGFGGDQDRGGPTMAGWPHPGGPHQVGSQGGYGPPPQGPSSPGPSSQGPGANPWGPPPGGPPWQGAPPPAPKRRRPWVVVAAVVGALALLAVVAGGAYLLLRQPAADPVPPPAAAAPGSTLIGDPRTADPCGLVSDGAIVRFGVLERFADYGLLGSCRVQITTPGGELVSVDAYLRSPDETAQNTGARDEIGGLSIIRPANDDTSCGRVILLGDGSGVETYAVRSEAGATDLCAVADAAATYAALVVATGTELPRRTFAAPTDRTAALDACTLLDAAALTPVSGLDTTVVAPSFANWGCVWGNQDTGPWVQVYPTRSGPSSVELDGTRSTVAGRDAYTSTEGRTGYCTMRVVLSSYTGATGNAREDVLLVQVSSPNDPCGQVARLAPIALQRLPA